MLFGLGQKKSCAACKYHVHRAVIDNRGYTEGDVCTCKDSPVYNDCTDKGHECEYYKKKKGNGFIFK